MFLVPRVVSSFLKKLLFKTIVSLVWYDKITTRDKFKYYT